MELIGSKLYEYRKLRGLSRSCLAEGICDKSTLYRIEKGLQEPQLFTLTQLCQKLGIDTDDVLNPLNREDIKYIGNMKLLCRKYVYDQNYSELEQLLNKIEKDFSHSNFIYADFIRFIDWHKAIILHELHKDIHKAKRELQNLIPKSEALVSETDIGIANSLGYIYIELDDKESALKIYYKIISAYENLPVIEDKLLYVRAVYNFIYIQYFMDSYDVVINKGLMLLEFLEVNYLKIMLAKLHHMIGISCEKKEDYAEAEFHVKKAADFFLVEDQIFNYLKALRALAEIQFKLGKIDEGTSSLLIVKNRLIELIDPKELPQLVLEMEQKYIRNNSINDKLRKQYICNIMEKLNEKSI